MGSSTCYYLCLIAFTGHAVNVGLWKSLIVATQQPSVSYLDIGLPTGLIDRLIADDKCDKC